MPISTHARMGSGTCACEAKPLPHSIWGLESLAGERQWLQADESHQGFQGCSEREIAVAGKDPCRKGPSL